MKKIWKSKRGISQIQASLLLIIIAVAAVIVTYAWIMTFTGLTTGQELALTVEKVRFYDSQHIEIILRNSGTGDVKADSVYIGTSVSNLVLQESSDVSYYPDTQIVVSGSTLNITITKSWTSGTIYHFNIVSEEGLTVPFQKRA